MDSPSIKLFFLSLLGFLPQPFYLCRWILFYLQVSKVQSHLGQSNSVSLLSYLSEICTHIYKHPTAVMPASIYTQPQPPPSLADGTFSLWSELQQCLQCNEIYEEEPLGMPAMRQQVPMLSENHTLAFIDCIMACMKMVSH